MDMAEAFVLPYFMLEIIKPKKRKDVRNVRNNYKTAKISSIADQIT